MDHWRAFVVFDPETKNGFVYTANSEHGDVLLKHIVPEEFKMEPTLNFISQKLGFAVSIEDQWQKKQEERMEQIKETVFNAISEPSDKQTDEIVNEVSKERTVENKGRPNKTTRG